jgi:hypothetical protein
MLRIFLLDCVLFVPPSRVKALPLTLPLEMAYLPAVDPIGGDGRLGDPSYYQYSPVPRASHAAAGDLWNYITG